MGRTGNHEWDAIHLLPNLSIPWTAKRLRKMDHWDLAETDINLDSTCIAIAHPRDSRVRGFSRRFPAFGRLLARSRDIYNRQSQPAVLVVRAGELKGQSETCLIAFRNCVALSVILLNRANYALDRNFSEPMWADSFDFHPSQVGRDGRVRTFTPAYIASHGSSGQVLVASSPYVMESGDRLEPDVYLYRNFGRAWHESFVELEETLNHRRLFRSLEVAYLVVSVPTKNYGSLNDYGVSLSLWVSALEILAWRQPNKAVPGRAGEKQVMELINSFDWSVCSNPQTGEPSVIAKRERSGSKDMNLVEWGASKLYRARNAFLHGNPVDERMIHAKDHGISLSTVAAMVYRTALKAFLVRTIGSETDDPLKGYKEAVDDHRFGDAFEAAIPDLNQLK